MFTPERPPPLNAQPDRQKTNAIGQCDRMRHGEKPRHAKYLAQSTNIHHGMLETMLGLNAVVSAIHMSVLWYRSQCSAMNSCALCEIFCLCGFFAMAHTIALTECSS